MESAVFKVAQEIAKAARTASQNKNRCLELAERARNVGDLLRDSEADKDTATRRRALGRLTEALGDALKLVESSCRRRLWFRLLAASRDARRFGDVDRRITNRLLELGIANDARLEKQVIQLAANTRAGSETETNVLNAKKKDVVKNDNKSSTIAAARKRRNKGRCAGRKAKQMKEKAAAAVVRNAKKKDVAKNDDKSSTTAAARKRRYKRRRAGGKGKQMKQKAAAAGPPPPPCGGEVHYCPPQHWFVHSVEEDPNSCSVM